MKIGNVERLTPIGSRRGWIGQVLLLALVLSGPHVVTRVVSLISSVATYPLTREISVANNAYEVFNLELLLVYIIVVVGLNLLVQTGLLSVGQTAPFAVGAYTTAIATTKWHWSFYVALLLAAVITGLLGVALGIPSLRLGIFTFAMVTLGYATVSQDLTLQWKNLTGGADGILGIKMPAPFDTPNRFYWLLAFLASIAYVVARNYIRSPMGRASAAVAGSPITSQAVGISITATKLRPFAVSCAFAGVAGGLYSVLLGFIAPDSFTLDMAVLFVLMVLLGGAGTVAGPIVGAIILFRIPLAAQKVTSQPGDWALLIYGLVLLLSVHFFPRGVMSGWAWIKARLSRAAPRAARTRGDVRPKLETLELDAPHVVGVTGIKKNLSGVQALDGIDLAVAPGTIHALIGPNGSGKTTLLNIMSGYLAPDEGTVTLLGDDVTAVAPHRRAARGIARTFQTPFVFEGLACRDNVMVAIDLHRRHDSFSYVARLPWARHEERRAYDRALELLEAVGLGGEATTPAGSLPPGERRLLELARVIALKPKVVLMDEPAAGLTTGEIDELAETIKALCDAGVAILLVEHHVEFVLRLAHEVTVIDFGRVIARGTPAEIRTNPVVIAAYLGEPIVEKVDGKLPTMSSTLEEPVA